MTQRIINDAVSRNKQLRLLPYTPGVKSSGTGELRFDERTGSLMLRVGSHWVAYPTTTTFAVEDPVMSEKPIITSATSNASSSRQFPLRGLAAEERQYQQQQQRGIRILPPATSDYLPVYPDLGDDPENEMPPPEYNSLDDIKGAVVHKHEVVISFSDIDVGNLRQILVLDKMAKRIKNGKIKITKSEDDDEVKKQSFLTVVRSIFDKNKVRIDKQGDIVINSS